MSFRRLGTQAYKSHSSQCCGVKLIDTQCKTVAVMVSYDSILHVCDLCGHEVCREFLVNAILVHMKQARAEQPWLPPLVWKYLNEATIDSCCYRQNEQEKRHAYDQWVREIEHGSFTPLVFSASGGMGPTARVFYKPNITKPTARP